MNFLISNLANLTICIKYFFNYKKITPDYVHRHDNVLFLRLPFVYYRFFMNWLIMFIHKIFLMIVYVFWIFSIFLCYFFVVFIFSGLHIFLEWLHIKWFARLYSNRIRITWARWTGKGRYAEKRIMSKVSLLLVLFFRIIKQCCYEFVIKFYMITLHI